MVLVLGEWENMLIIVTRGSSHSVHQKHCTQQPTLPIFMCCHSIKALSHQQENLSTACLGMHGLLLVARNDLRNTPSILGECAGWEVQLIATQAI